MIKKKKKKNRILITLCAMFLAVASVFAFIPFTRNDTKVVKADTIIEGGYTFNGSKFNAIFTPWNTSSSSFDMTVPFRCKDLGVLPTHFFSFSFSANSSNLITDIVGTSYDCYSSYSYDTSKSDLIGHFYPGYNIFLDAGEIGPYNVAYVDIKASNIINNSIYLGVPVSCAFEIERDYTSDRNYLYFNLYYYDIDNNYILFKFFINSPYTSDDDTYNIYYHLDMPYRRYFFSSNLNLNDNQYYQLGYDNGYFDGNNYGYNTGYDIGINTGYNSGYNVGYNCGYSAGSEDTNRYTFLNLVSATIDAPIKYFQSLFNFELLGVNLQGFLTGLFTLCVIVTIIKMVL